MEQAKAVIWARCLPVIATGRPERGASWRQAKPRAWSFLAQVKQIASKGWCTSKNMWYYGVKLHLLAHYRLKGLPKPDDIGLTGAAHHDLTALRPRLPFLQEGQRCGDRIYADQILKDTLLKEQNLAFYTPVKRKKGQDRLMADEKRFSQKVSRIRQHIEGLFRWRDRKTNLSVASQARSYNGLLVHVFGRLAAACFLLAFYS